MDLHYGIKFSILAEATLIMFYRRLLSCCHFMWKVIILVGFVVES